MALSGTIEGKPEAMVAAISNSYGSLADATSIQEAGREAGRALAGHIELALIFLTRLVETTGRPPDALLREALAS